MDRRQTLIVVGLMVMVFAGIVAATFFVQREGGARGPLDATKRFTAKSGTSRENAVALTSSKRESEPGTVASTGSGAVGNTGDGNTRIGPLQPMEIGERDKPLTVKSLSRPENEEELSPTEQAIYSARNSLDPAKAIAQLEAMVDEGVQGQAGSALHRALGELYSQKDPPDEVRAQAAFDRARALAASEAERREAQLAEAEALVASGKFELAQAKLEVALAESDLNTLSGLKLGVLHAQLQERAGDLATAERSYREIFDRALKMELEESEEALRLSGLRLARLYQAQQRDDEADAVAGQLRRRLDAGPQGEPTSPRK